jgi:phosphoribosylglycinamide formyltransferase-1
MQKIAIFASYNGSSLESIHKACEDGTLALEVSLVVTNNSNANVLNKAKEKNIPAFVVNDKLYEDVDTKLVELLDEHGCENIFLAGYMKKVSPILTRKYKMINSHPALLPKYGGKGMYGRNVHEAVVAAGEKQSGVTVHEVNENYDEGATILQKSIELEDGETPESLETKIKKLEQVAVVEALIKYV